jgi:hypothetical protein
MIKLKQLYFETSDGGTLIVARDEDEKRLTITHNVTRFKVIPLNGKGYCSTEFVNEWIAPFIFGRSYKSPRPMIMATNAELDALQTMINNLCY